MTATQASTGSPTQPFAESPTKTRLLKRYFFPINRPESPGCGAYLVGMVASDSEWGREVSKYESENPEYRALLKKWGLSEEELFQRPSSKQVDLWLDEGFVKIKSRGLSKLGLSSDDLDLPEYLSDLLPTKAENPMRIEGPLLTKETTIPSHENVVVLRDGNIRFSCYEVMIVALTQTRIATYTCYYNFIRDSVVQENAKEFLYADVVSVATEELLSNYKFSTGQNISLRRQFKLAVASGDNIVVSVASPELQEKFGAQPLLSKHDERIRAIREMLRVSKASQVVSSPDPVLDAMQTGEIANNPTKKLKALKEMLDAELITDEEYKNKKQEILSRI